MSYTLSNKFSKRELISDLIRLKVHESEHSNRRLLDHLIGVSELLEQWGNPEHICLAGLFHSIYGTINYKNITLDFKHRNQIKNLIGSQAEQLVYYFSILEREHFLSNFDISCQYKIKNAISKEEILVTRNTVSSLAEISVANMVEQLPYIFGYLKTYQFQKIFCDWKKSRCFISEKAFSYFIENLNFFFED